MKSASKGSNMQGKSTSKKPASKSYLSRENLVSEVGARWWYVLPEWPPKDYDYSKKLAENGLREVLAEKFSFEPETDSSGRRKVWMVEAYPGVFQDSKGQLYDMRPQETCPSINNLMKKSVQELKELAIAAIQKQLEQWDKSIVEELQNKLKLLGK